MPELDINALKDALKIEKDLKSFAEKYGRDALNTILESLGFYGLIGLVNHESIDDKELVTYIDDSKNETKEKNKNSVVKPGPYESDSPDKFGLYKDIIEEKNRPTIDASIYSQDVDTLSKVAEDKKTHPSNKELPSDNDDDDELDVIIPDSYFDNVDKREEKPLTKVKNPWESAGNPVSPGQIKF